MFIGTLKFELLIPGSGSLKDKRRVVRSLKDRLKARFNVSVAEIEYQDKWQRTVLGLCTVNGSRSEVESTLFKVREVFNDSPEFMIIGEKNSIICVREE